jgi:pyrimidine operon attenuation protein/uracil phosphoribosyltransferase
MNLKTKILDSKDIKRTLMRLSHEIVEKNKGVEDIILIGIKTRGVFIAQRLKDNLKLIESFDVPVGELDVTPYRDDNKKSENDTSKIENNLNGKKVILVDDVLFTGRTIRAAMEGLIKRGRPEFIELLVLVDRGHREFPVRANYIGKNLPTSKSREEVLVKLANIDTDMEEGVYIFEKE